MYHIVGPGYAHVLSLVYRDSWTILCVRIEQEEELTIAAADEQ